MGHRLGKAGRRWSVTWGSGALKAAAGFLTVQPSPLFPQERNKGSEKYSDLPEPWLVEVCRD